MSRNVSRRALVAVSAPIALLAAFAAACTTGPLPRASTAGGDASIDSSGSSAASASTSSAPVASTTSAPTAIASASASATPAASVERGDHAFAARLYGTQRDAKGNLLVAPASARVALSMAWVGAKGSTAKQMGEVLGFDGDADAVSAEVSRTLARWNAADDPKVKLRVANATWGDRGVPFTATWLDAMKGRYGAPLQQVDFRGAYEPARATINDWIAAKTEQKLLGTLKEGDLTTFTRFVLVNATYFDGQWAHAFDAKATREGAFHVEAGRDAKRPLMHQSARFKYGETADAQVLSMPYGKGGYSMVVVLPKETFGLGKLEKGMTGATIDGWLGAATWEQEVDVTFPKLQAEARLSLATELAKLGMKDAFDPRAADFSGIAPHKGFEDNLYLAKVIQKSWIKIDERGTEAAAATVVIGAVPTAVAPMPRVFDATHPFLYLLRDEAGNVLFMGRVVEP